MVMKIPINRKATSFMGSNVKLFAFLVSEDRGEVMREKRARAIITYSLKNFKSPWVRPQLSSLFGVRNITAPRTPNNHRKFIAPFNLKGR